MVDAWEWCVASAGVEVIYHYLDNFAVLGLPGSEQCGHNLGLLKAVCNDLGIVLASEKKAGSAAEIKFLGIVIDTSLQELCLQTNKLEHCRVSPWI